MQRIVILLGVFFLLSGGGIHASNPGECTAADTKTGLYVFLDGAVVDAAWANQVTVRGGISAALVPGVTFELPLMLMIDRTSGNEMLFDIVLNLKYHPWEEGPFIGVSLAQVCMFVGTYRPPETYHFLNEISFGYTWHIGQDLYMEPLVTFRDPSGSFNDSYAYVHGLVPGYRKFQIGVQFGWCFLSLADGRA
jgi:hypothetical protein